MNTPDEQPKIACLHCDAPITVSGDTEDIASWVVWRSRKSPSVVFLHLECSTEWQAAHSRQVKYFHEFEELRCGIAKAAELATN